MQYGALRGASFVVGATCEWGLSEKITKAAQKLTIAQVRLRFIAISLE
jgi:hypothetical protein